MVNLSPAVTGFLRTLGSAVLFGASVAVLNFLGDATHLNGVVNDSLALLIAAAASAYEHKLEADHGSALFGAVAVRKA